MNFVIVSLNLPIIKLIKILYKHKPDLILLTCKIDKIVTKDRIKNLQTKKILF